MTRTKLFLASMATGIFVTTGIFFTLLFVRALFKTDVAMTVTLWIFWWPICFVRFLPTVSHTAQIWIAFALGIVLDMVIISLVTYCILRAISSRQKRVQPSIPPQPPTF